MRNGEISHWMAGRAPTPSGELPSGPADIAVVGGGLTGLWLAYYASQRHPDASIVVLEAEHVGFGASGRNGGWLSPLLPGNRGVYARRASRDGVVRLQRAMFDGIDETLRVAESEGLDILPARGGNLLVATSPAQLQRLRATRRTHLHYGYAEDEVRELDADDARAHIDIAGMRGALHLPSTTAIDPAALVLGLADVCRARGVRIIEGVRATGIEPGRVSTDRGDVRAETVACCAEAYSGPLVGERRLIPVNSSLIATEPLDVPTWERIGWQARECLGDAAHAFIYAQRTADGRIAIGGRGAPYRYGSGLPGRGEVDARTIDQLRGRLRQFFPDLDLPVAHAWRGVIGVTRDWCASVSYDPAVRVGSVLGYAGHGVTATNVAARTMLDRVDGLTTDLTGLPWNDHRSRSWEPEPLRWIGVHAMYRLFGFADDWETRRQSASTSLLATVGSRIAGLHE